jgi:hypothetical protein
LVSNNFAAHPHLLLGLRCYIFFHFERVCLLRHWETNSSAGTMAKEVKLCIKGDAKKLSSRLEQLSIPLLCYSLFSQQKLTFYLCGRKSLRAPFLNLERRLSFAARKLHAYAKFTCFCACICMMAFYTLRNHPSSLLVKENIAF